MKNQLIVAPFMLSMELRLEEKGISFRKDRQLNGASLVLGNRKWKRKSFVMAGKCSLCLERRKASALERELCLDSLPSTFH